MTDDVARIRKVMGGLIASSFPELEGVRFVVRVTRSESFVAALRFLAPLPWMALTVSREDLLRMSNRALRGVLAHEFCHADEYLRLSWVRRLFSDRFMSDERSVDMAVIARGCGRDLLAFQIYHDSIYEAYQEEDGMTLDEISAELARREYISRAVEHA